MSDLLAMIHTLAPNSTNSFAVAFPMPVEAPHNIAVFPVKECFLLILSLVIIPLLYDVLYVEPTKNQENRSEN
jgi:hypothetical protein